MAILLESGADVNAKDNRGKTALMYATFNGATKIAELLEAAGARSPLAGKGEQK